MELDDVYSDRGHVFVEVAIENITRILRNSDIIDPLARESDDGEILTLKQKECGATLVIEWVNYNPIRVDVVAYDLVGGTMSSELI